MCGDRGESVDAGHRVEQGHVLGPVERQTLSAVMVHHLGDAGEDAAALVQGVAVFFSLSHDDVDAALARPNAHRREEEEKTHIYRLQQAPCLETSVWGNKPRFIKTICGCLLTKFKVCDRKTVVDKTVLLRIIWI